MSDEWVLWLNGADISPIQPRPAEWGWIISLFQPFSPIHPPIQPHLAPFMTWCMCEYKRSWMGLNNILVLSIQPHSAGLGWMGEISAPLSHNTHSSDMPCNSNTFRSWAPLLFWAAMRYSNSHALIAMKDPKGMAWCIMPDWRGLYFYNLVFRPCSSIMHQWCVFL